jgi:hypothetical protein
MGLDPVRLIAKPSLDFLLPLRRRRDVSDEIGLETPGKKGGVVQEKRKVV